MVYPSVEMTLDPHSNIIQRFINHCWDGRPLDEDDYALFTRTIKEPGSRKAWAALFNVNRTSGQFCIPHNTFPHMEKMLSTVLDSMLEAHDFVYLKHCIILSQTYFKSEGDFKVFLQTLIKDHHIWRCEGIWQSVVLSSANEELENFTAMCQEEDQEELP